MIYETRLESLFSFYLKTFKGFVKIERVDYEKGQNEK